MANSITLQLIADANPLLKAMDSAQKSISKFVDASESAGQAIGGGLNKAIDTFMNFSKGGANAAGILAGGFVAAAAGAVALTANAGRQAESLDMLSQKTGIALNTLQNWSVIMAENDFQAESLTSAMRTLSTKMVEARDPASKAASAFEEMGIAAESLGSTESLIKSVADRFSKMADGPEKAKIAVDLFGRSGLDLIPILNRGGAALDESKNAAERFAAVLRSNQIKALEAADDAMDRVGVAAGALKNQLGAVFAPSVEMGAKALADILGFMANMVRDVDTAMDTLAIRITHLSLAAKELGSVLFSKDIINSDAWKQALQNVTLIDQEAAKLIAKRGEMAEVLEAPEVKVTASPYSSEQVALGEKLRNQHIAIYQALLVQQRAEEALGKTVVQIIQRENAERNKEFGLMVQEEERVRVLNLELSKPPTSGPFVAAIEQKEAAVRNLLNIMPELSREEAIVLATENQANAEAAINQATQAYLHRNDALEMTVARMKVLDEAQQTMFQTEHTLFGASDAARETRMRLIEAEGALERQVIEQTVLDEQKKVEAITNLEIQLDTKRRQVIQAYPSFFEQQMQAIVQSNSFSIAQITTTWTSGLANAAVNGGDFVKQAWKSTEVALIQSALNFGVQKLAGLALQTSAELGIISARAAAELGINTAKNATLVAEDTATASTIVGVWEASSAAVLGTFTTIFTAVQAFFVETIIPILTEMGTAIMGFLSAMAASLDMSIFGAPFSIPIWAAVGLMAAAIGAIAAFAFADGGIVTKPVMGLVGEAGPEAIIPLSKLGSLQGNNGGHTSIIVELDGRQIARSVFDSMPSIMRVRGIPV